MTPCYDNLVDELGFNPVEDFIVEDFAPWNLETQHPVTLREMLHTLEYTLRQREEHTDAQTEQDSGRGSASHLCAGGADTGGDGIDGFPVGPIQPDQDDQGGTMEPIHPTGGDPADPPKPSDQRSENPDQQDAGDTG